MPSRRFKQLAELRNKIKSQRDWIRDHGNDRAGYAARYGDSGAGSDAIFDADVAKLRALETQLRLMGGSFDVHGGTD